MAGSMAGVASQTSIYPLEVACLINTEFLFTISIDCYENRDNDQC